MSLLFFILAGLAVFSAMGVIAARNPVYSALSLVVTLLSLAGLYLLLHGEFLAVIQVLTYAGAILVLFIFIIMLLNLKEEDLWEKGPGTFGKVLLMLTAVVGFVSLGFVMRWVPTQEQGLPEGFGSVASVGGEIFTRYVLPFEISGVLLTVALIGAVLLAKKDLK